MDPAPADIFNVAVRYFFSLGDGFVSKDLHELTPNRLELRCNPYLNEFRKYGFDWGSVDNDPDFLKVREALHYIVTKGKEAGVSQALIGKAKIYSDQFEKVNCE